MASRPADPSGRTGEADVIAASVAELDPLQGLEQAAFWLQAYLQTQPADAQRAFEVLDHVDQVGQPHRMALMREYLDAGGRMQTYREHRLWRAASAYARVLADGYAYCLRLAQKRSDARSRALLPAAAARAMRALTLELRWALLRYANVDPAVWSRMGTLYAFCEQHDLAMLRFKVYPGMSGDSTLRREYLRALVLAVSAMGNLLPAGQVVAERAIAALAEFFLLHRRPSAGCHFGVDTQADRPPYRLGDSITPARGVRFFGAGDAGVMLEGLLRDARESGRPPARLGLPGSVDVEQVIEVLQHLARHWSAQPPARAEVRQRVLAKAHVAHGFVNVVAAVATESDDQREDNFTEAWTVENESSGGFGAVLPARGDDWLSVGRLVAAKPDWPGSWSVGVVRRVSERSPALRAVGVQILARGGVVVELTPVPPDQGLLPLECILLPVESQTSTRGGEVAIVVPKGVSVLLDTCEMRLHGRNYLLSRRRISDSGEDFEVTRFAVRAL